MRNILVDQPHSVEEFLERQLSQLIHCALGQRPESIHCKFVDHSDLAIVINGVNTLAEMQLRQHGKLSLAKAFRQGLNQALCRRICRLVEQTTHISVNGALVSRQTDTAWLGLWVSLQLDTAV